MFDLTVGQISGVIAAAVFFLQLVIPNAIPLVIAGTLKDEHNAVTWGVAQREIARSLWPTLTCADSVATQRVDGKVKVLSWVRLLVLTVISIAAIITPLGLYDLVAASSSPVLAIFVYVEDPGAFGSATLARNGLPFTRYCGPLEPCPGMHTNAYANTTSNDSSVIWHYEYDTFVPASIGEIYQSGLATSSQTLSSFFDLEWRRYSYNQRDPYKNINYNKTYPVGNFRPAAQIGLDDNIELIEGLVIDTDHGGIGLRNHSIPVDLVSGGVWTEDILFIEPETMCVPTNLSIEFRLPEFGTFLENMSLIDHGGFHNINRSFHDDVFEKEDWPMPTESPGQDDPRLEERAWRAAWVMSYELMLYLNVTRPAPPAFPYLDSHEGKHFVLEPSAANSPSVNSFTASQDFYAFYSFQSSPYDTPKPGYYPNPWNRTTLDMDLANDWCAGNNMSALSNINTIGVMCGWVLGIAKPADETNSALLQAGSKWSQDISVCASTTKVSVKTVSFSYNVTRSASERPLLKNLQVTSIAPKHYTHSVHQPTWGVESANMSMYNSQPLWGIVDPLMTTHVNEPMIISDHLSPNNAPFTLFTLTHHRSPHLYLSGYLTNSLYFSSFAPLQQNLPGSEAALTSLVTTYLTGTYIGSTGANGLTDYSGNGNGAMLKRWRELSQGSDSRQGTAKIINWIWTDLMANAVAGTRGWVSGGPTFTNKKRDSGSEYSANAAVEGDQPVKVLVYPYTRQVRYRWVFAIPAAVALVLSGALMGIAALMGVTGKKGGTPRRIAELLRLLSVGRLLDAIVQDEKRREGESEKSCDHDQGDRVQHKETLWTMSGKAWIERLGSLVVKLPVTSGSHGNGEENEDETEGRREHRREKEGVASRLRISDPRVMTKNTAIRDDIAHPRCRVSNVGG